MVQLLCTPPREANDQNETPNLLLRGKIEIAKMGSLSYMKRGMLATYQAELDGINLTLFSPQTIKEVKKVKVSFCTQLSPPDKITSKNFKYLATAETILAKDVLALYTDGGVFWLQFDNNQDLLYWQSAIQQSIGRLEKPEARDNKFMSYAKLEPMIWHQADEQASVWSLGGGGGALSVPEMSGISLETIQRDFAHHGWLEIRSFAETQRHGNAAAVRDNEWVERYVTICGGCLLWFDSEHHLMEPIDSLSLHYASLRMGNDFSGFTFAVTTPLHFVELRAPNLALLQDWAEKIIQVQASLSMQAIPDYKPSFPFLLRIKNLASKGLNRGESEDLRSLEGEENIASSERFPDTQNLRNLLKDSRLSEIARNVADEEDLSRDLELIMMAEGPSTRLQGPMKMNQEYFNELSEGEQNRLLDLAGLSHASCDLFQKAYSDAYTHVWKAVMPKLRLTDEYANWTMMEQFVEYKKFHFVDFVAKCVNSSPQSEVSTLQASIEKWFGRDGWCALQAVSRIGRMFKANEAQRQAIGRELLQFHLVPEASSPIFCTEGIRKRFFYLLQPAHLIRNSSPIEEVEARRKSLHNALLELEHHLLSGIESRFETFQLSSEYRNAVFEDANTDKLHLDFLHWIHSAAGLCSLQEWIDSAHASENLKFVSDVIAFKRINDICAIKAAATGLASTYLVPGAISEVALPSDMIDDINNGLKPKFPSACLFDQSANYVISHMRQDLWPSFKLSLDFSQANEDVSTALYRDSSDARMIVRVCQGVERHIFQIHKKIILIGPSSDCDIQLPGSDDNIVLWIERGTSHRSCAVAQLWGKSQVQSGGVKTSKMATLGQKSGPSGPPPLWHRVLYGSSFFIGDLQVTLFSDCV